MHLLSHPNTLIIQQTLLITSIPVSSVLTIPSINPAQHAVRAFRGRTRWFELSHVFV